MSAARLRKRVGCVKDLGHVTASNTRLVFTSLGESSHFASHISARGHLLHGRLFDLHPLQFEILDIYEGAPVCYHRSAMALYDDEGKPTIATAFNRNPNATIGLPSKDYEQFLLNGYVAMAMLGVDIDELLEAHIDAIRFTITHEGKATG